METIDLEIVPEEQRGFIQAESANLSKEISEIKVSNRESYERGLTLGIANSNILKRLEDLRKAMLMPYELQIKQINEKFKPIQRIFDSNDEVIRKRLLTYQEKVNVDNIKTIHNDLGSATIQERTDFEIEDESLIPDEYYKLDEAKIGKVVRAGGSVPGVKTFKKLSTAFKAA